MTDAAAISGSFAEFRMVKTRSVCVLSIEIPVEQADAALKALGGVPQPGRERPVAVVLLDPTKYQAARTGDASPAGPHAEVAEAPATADARALPSPSTAPEVAGSGGHHAITSGPLAATPAASTQPPEETPKAPAKQRHAGAASQDKVVTRAAILCGEPEFQRWLQDQFIAPFYRLERCTSEDERVELTARNLRQKCMVLSRRDLAIDGDARKRFLALVERYEMDTGRRAERRSA